MWAFLSRRGYLSENKLTLYTVLLLCLPQNQINQVRSLLTIDHSLPFTECILTMWSKIKLQTIIRGNRILLGMVGGGFLLRKKEKSLNVIYFCNIPKAEVRRDRVKIPFFGHLCATQRLGKSKIKRKESKTRSPKDGPFVYIFFTELQSSRELPFP